jgi:hypothetical protein
VMNRIDPDLFMDCFSSWVAECWPDKLKFVAIDVTLLVWCARISYGLIAVIVVLSLLDPSDHLFRGFFKL